MEGSGDELLAMLLCLVIILCFILFPPLLLIAVSQAVDLNKQNEEE